MRPADTDGQAPRAGGRRARQWRPVPPRSRWTTLHGRASLGFAALTLMLSAAMAVAVWITVSTFLLDQREQTAASQALANADQVERGLRAEGLTPVELLSQLPRRVGSTSLLVIDGKWFTTSLQIGQEDLPDALRTAVLSGQASQQRIAVDDRTMIAVGLPLAGLEEAYFEVFPLDELDDTLRVLSAVLLGAATAVTVGSLALGWWVTRPALRPLQGVADAAAGIAAGDLDTRLDPGGDPQLMSIAGSFNATADALQRRVRRDARFAADVSHELRTPLTTMLSAVALTEGYRDHLPPDGQEALELLRSEVDRFARLVQDLLEISRADAGSADVALTDVTVAELVSRTLPTPLRKLLVVRPPADEVTVRTDKRRLERAVANLVENAERHGGGLVAVTVQAPAGTVEVVVDDAGPGIRAEDSERIFERFARGRGSERVSTQGAGLGLSLVARYMHLLGGEVRVESSPEGGARFVLTLPAGAAG